MKKIIIVATALTLLALACGEEGVTESGPEGAESPAEALETVEIAFNERAIKVLASALSENFVFYFDPDDVGQHPPGSEYEVPVSWSDFDFMDAARKMFKGAYSISLAIPTGNVGEPDPNATTYTAENINIKLLVMVDEIGGYIVDQGYCDVEFERYYSGERRKLWRIRKWWDDTSWSQDANPGVCPISLGRLLAIYYCQL